jgi:hypothetical protein
LVARHTTNGEYGEVPREIFESPDPQMRARFDYPLGDSEIVDVGGSRRTYERIYFRTDDLRKCWPVRALSQLKPPASHLDRWYKKRHDDWPKGERGPSREKDLAAAKEEFPDRSVTTVDISSLRKKYAADWGGQRRPRIQPEN